MCEPQGIPVGNQVVGYYQEGFFFAGEWSPRMAERTMQCRRFYEGGTKDVEVWHPRDNTVFLRSSVYGGSSGSRNGCVVDWLVAGGGFVENSVCSGYAHGWWTPGPAGMWIWHDGHAGEKYISSMAPSASAIFETVYITNNTASFRVGDSPTIDPRVTAIQNHVLEMIRTPGMFQDVEFDRLDHECKLGQNNSVLGRYSRSWESDNDEPGPTVATFECSRLKWGMVPFIATLFIAKVWFALDLQLYHQNDFDTAHSRWRDFVAPHSVLRIQAWLGLRTSIDGPPPPDDALYYAEYDGVAAHWPRIITVPHPPDGWAIPSDGNPMLLAQEPGQYFVPPAYVEWRGQLNDFSAPNLAGQGFPAEVDAGHGFDADFRTLKTALGSWSVPGAPSDLDANMGDRNQIWDGNVAFRLADVA